MEQSRQNSAVMDKCCGRNFGTAGWVGVLLLAPPTPKKNKELS